MLTKTIKKLEVAKQKATQEREAQERRATEEHKKTAAGALAELKAAAIPEARKVIEDVQQLGWRRLDDEEDVVRQSALRILGAFAVIIRELSRTGTKLPVVTKDTLTGPQGGRRLKSLVERALREVHSSWRDRISLVAGEPDVLELFASLGPEVEELHRKYVDRAFERSEIRHALQDVGCDLLGSVTDEACARLIEARLSGQDPFRRLSKPEES